MVIEKTKYPYTLDDPFGEGPGRTNAGNPAALTAGCAPMHVQRMMAEVQQVVARYRNLAGFMETKTFSELPAVKQRLMFEQLDQMQAYAKTLSLRYCMELLETEPVRK